MPTYVYMYMYIYVYIYIYAELGILPWRAQVRKLFFVAPQHKLRFSKAQLRSLRFNILDGTLIATFMIGFGMVRLVLIGSYSVVVKSSAW